MTEHTPGPWLVDYDCGDTFINSFDGEPIAMIDRNNANKKGNATLIARAPELLEENKRLKDRIAELEAKRMWQTISELPNNTPVILFDSATWAVASAVEVNEGHRIVVDPKHMKATHFMPLPKVEDE